MFGHDSLPSKVFMYGAGAPIQGDQEINDEISRMHKYRNRLVEIELGRRGQVDKAIIELRPALAEVEAALLTATANLDTAITASKAQNATARRQRITPGERANITELRNARKTLYAQRKELRAEAFKAEDVKLKLTEIETKNKRDRLDARAISGLRHGNYTAIEESMGSSRTGAPPVFHRWRPNGRIRVQISNGMPTREVFDGFDTRLQIDKPDCLGAAKWDKHSRTKVRIRIGSTEDRRPIWGEFPITLHRPLPDGAQIKWASTVRKRIATHDHWSLQLVVSKAGGWAPSDLAETGEVGIDVGWRLVESGLRVAYWAGSDDKYGELVIPHAALESWRRVESLQSIRDINFNGAVDVLARWRDREPTGEYPQLIIKRLREKTPKNTKEAENTAAEILAWSRIDVTLGSVTTELPEWFTERIKQIRSWRAPARLAALVLHWRENRFADDEIIFNAIEQWRRRDKHLYEYQENLRDQVLARRKHLYRNFAARLCRQYRTAKIEDTNWARMQQNQLPEAPAQPGGVKTYMRIASVGFLLETVQRLMKETVRVPAKNTTRKHYECGQLSGEAKPANQFHSCACGKTYDQDENAARNLLAYVPELLNAGATAL